MKHGPVPSVFFPTMAAIMMLAARPVHAQLGPGGPPAVGVVKAALQPITQTNQFIGRIESTNRVALVARVTAFLQERLFVEGSEVKQGDVLYRLERGPFEADVQQKVGAVAQLQATLQNAQITLNRAQALLNTPAGQRSTVDDARASELSQEAQLMQAQANLRASSINLDYTEIRAPITGKIGRTAVTIGNVVTPSSGTLATIVSQDPMYVTFPVSTRTAFELRDRYAGKGFAAVQIKLQLPTGKLFPQVGKLDFVNNTIDANTDTILLRGVIANPLLPGAKPNDPGSRDLTDGEFVDVLLQGVDPVEVLAIPRAAVLSDQQGNYVYVVDSDNKAQQRRVQLGQSTPATASIVSGLQAGENVILEGIQRARPGQPVSPGPASPPAGATAGKT